MKTKTLSIADIAKQDGKFLSKYAALFLTILGFLAITTAFAVVGYQISKENKKNTELLNVVGVEKTLSQQISKDILIIQKEWKDSQKFNTVSFESLSSSQRAFEEIHNALAKGGKAAFDSNSHDIEALGQDYKAELDKIGSAWGPLKIQIDMLGKTYKESSTQETKLSARDKFLNSRKTFTTEVNESNKSNPFANDFLNSSQKFAPTSFGSGANELLSAEVTKTSNTFNLYSNDLLANVEKLNALINKSITQKEEFNFKVQGVMTALSLVLFFILTFYFLRKNIFSDFIIFNEDKEKKAILDNVNEGLFLMDSNWVVKSEGSLFLHKLFGQKIPLAADFKQILANSVDADTLENAEKFVNILIKKKIKGSMIESLNPLKLIPLRAIDASGDAVVKHVSVHFGQISDANGKLKHILVGIQDSTEKQKLSLDLKDEIRKNKETFSMLARLVKSSNINQVSKLLTSTRELIETNNAKIKSGKHKEHQLLDFLHDLKNEVHGFKNDAGLLKVDILQKLLHDFEEQLNILEKKGNITYESFLDIPYQFKDILEAVDLIELLLGIKPIDANDFQELEGSTLIADLNQAITQTSEKLGKKTLLSFDDAGFSHQPLFEQKSSVFRTCFIHLAKNSVIHGIELPEERARLGKNPTGNLTINSVIESGRINIRISDDGAGLNTERIRKKIAVLGINEKPLDQYTDHQLHQFIFEHDFSTVETVTMDAGRGVGLNYVKNAVEAMGGKIIVTTNPGRGTSFMISIPV